MTVDEEVALVVAVLRHPASFNLDFAGNLLGIRSTDQDTIEVEWEEAGVDVRFLESWNTAELEVAARFFIETRHRLKYGIDYEIEEMK